MKLRAPRRFATAVTRIKTALGEDRCAEIVGRSASLIRKWSDPDHPSRPNLPQALALDVAFVEGGYGEAPILALYQERLARAVSESQEISRPIDVALAALAVQASVGDVSQSIISLRGKGGTISPNERNEILQHLERLQQQTSQIEDALDISNKLLE